MVNNPPIINSINSVDLKELQIVSEKNFFLHNSDSELFKVIIDYPIVKDTIAIKCAVLFLSEMFFQGTNTKDWVTVSKEIDKTGGDISLNSGLEFISFTISGLNRNSDKLVGLFWEMFNSNIYPEERFDSLKKSFHASVKQSWEKPNSLATKKSWQSAFKDHAFGLKLKPEDVQDFEYIDFIKLVPTLFVEQPFVHQYGKIPIDFNFNEGARRAVGEVNFFPGHEVLYLDDIQQSSLRMMCWCGEATYNEQYFSENFTLKLFGGYFGSRLMQSIREDKGYTYGISAYKKTTTKGELMFLSSEVELLNIKKCVDEVFNQIEILQNELVPEKELAQLKSYTIGEMLRGLDGVSALLSYYRNENIYQKSPDRIQQYLKRIESISPNDIQKAAQKLFPKSDTYYLYSQSQAE